MNLAQALILLRIHFSFFLLPVFMFAASLTDEPDLWRLLWIAIVLHLFLYPASNAYNSYMDQDEGPIGGIKNPPKAGKLVFWLSVLFNIIGLALSWFMLGQLETYLLAAYVIASLAYSWKGIRIKRYAIPGFLTVVLFQGAFIYAFTFIFGQRVDPTLAIQQINFFFPLIVSTLLMAGVYPMTQVYQHQADKQAGDHTLSLLLGIRGTFEFCAYAFLVAFALLGYHFISSFQSHLFYLFVLFNFPTLAFFLWWAQKVWADPSQANFRYTMMLNKTSSFALVLYFLLVYYLRSTHELPF